jgi:Peptidase A4 family
MEPNVILPKNRLRFFRFSLLIVLSLAVAAAGSFALVQSFHGARTPSQKASPHRKHSQPLAVQQTTPIQWAATFGPISDTSGTLEAHNWSGHIFTGPTFTSVSGQWVVPTVQASATGAYSATWIGVDGVNNTSLVQAGTAQDTSNGATTYDDWYEILPANETLVASVSPGDQIQASISEGSPGNWTIAITDITSGQSFSQAFAYNGAGTSAEWIEEAPAVSGQPSVLANFGTAQFTGMAFSSSNPSSLVNTTVNMIDGGGNVIASAGTVANNSFTIAR